ncbi:MAG: signal transduction histidine kinase/CheY-like chemotaxis protein [Brevundimonas sp.]|jgi:signal transduction histidine kinase/CheY-like chemotaxis protein
MTAARDIVATIDGSFSPFSHLHRKAEWNSGDPVLETIDCLATEHDWRLLIAAVFVCVVGTVTCMRLFVQSQTRMRTDRLLLLMAAGLVGGVAVWTTHFVAMLAFQPGTRFDYDIIDTLGSLLIVTSGAAVGLLIASQLRSMPGRILGGVLIGAAVSAMHYTGMSAVRLQGFFTWDPSLVIGGVVLSSLLWGAALAVIGVGGWRRTAGAAALAVLGICSLHFSGMAAADITIDPTLPLIESGSGVRMGVSVAAFAAFLVTAAAVVEALSFWSRASMLTQLREAIDAMPDGLAFYDSHDRLVIWNARYAEINPEIADILAQGATFRQIVQIGIDKGHYPEAEGREAEWLEERLTARSRLSCAIEQKTSDDRWLKVQDRRTADGGVVTLVNDITDLKRDAEILAAARDAAEAANRAKSEFLANMSHEIRTPLNGVIGVAQALSGTPMNERQQEMLELIRSSGATLQHLLSDILDLARVESGRMELRNEPFDLAKAVNEAAQLYAAQAEEKGLRFFVDTPEDTRVWIDGDVVRLKQVLTNLVSNAVKFTTQGLVSLSVSRGVGAAGEPVFRFMVEDTGVGFDAAARARLFSRFEQADGTITRRFGGTGLGLAICRELAGMMGGDLDCESEPGGGSTFILTAPLKEIAAPALETAPVEVSSAASDRPLRVLLSDDHPTNRKVVELILSQIDVELIITEDGAEALAAFRDDTFDVVLMDMQMPVMDGLTATREIRLHETAMGAPRTPVVMLTANALPEHMAAAREAGADHHLSKPFGAEALIELVQNLARNAAALDEVAA